MYRAFNIFSCAWLLFEQRYSEAEKVCEYREMDIELFFHHYGGNRWIYRVAKKISEQVSKVSYLMLQAMMLISYVMQQNITIGVKFE